VIEYIFAIGANKPIKKRHANIKSNADLWILSSFKRVPEYYYKLVINRYIKNSLKMTFHMPLAG